MIKNVFVTGSTGLVGARLIFDLYEKGCNITALIRHKSSIANLTKTLNFYTNQPNKIIESVNWVEGNILDEQVLFEQIEPNMDVYHCAAMVSFHPKNSKALTEVNVQGTANIVNVCVDKKVHKFCHVSSIGALGTPVKGQITDIDSPWIASGKSPYSISKHNSEMEVWRGIAEGLNAVIVNPAVIIGAGDWRKSSAALFSRMAKGMKYFTLGETGYVYVNDITRAMLKLMESDISRQRFILSAKTLSFKTLFQEISTRLNVKAPQKAASPILTSIVWRLEALRSKITGGEPVISKYSHKIAHSKSAYNGLPITQLIDFEYTPIEEAIANIAKMYYR